MNTPTQVFSWNNLIFWFLSSNFIRKIKKNMGVSLTPISYFFSHSVCENLCSIFPLYTEKSAHAQMSYRMLFIMAEVKYVVTYKWPVPWIFDVTVMFKGKFLNYDLVFNDGVKKSINDTCESLLMSFLQII